MKTYCVATERHEAGMFQETGMMEPPTLKGTYFTYAKACSLFQDVMKCLSDMEILFPNQLEWQTVF